MLDRLTVEATSPIAIHYPEFNEEILEKIREGSAIAYSDTLIRAGVMGGYWILTNCNKSTKNIKYTLNLGTETLSKVEKHIYY